MQRTTQHLPDKTQTNKNLDKLVKPLIATAAVLSAGAGTVWTGYEYGFKPIIKSPVETPIKYDYKPESFRKNSYTVEQVALPINLPNTNKDFIKIKLETGKILRVKSRGEKVTKPIFMYEAKDSNGKYIDSEGNEYYLTKNSDNSFNILNEQRMGGQTESIFITRSPESTIIPSPNANIHTAIQELSKQGYEVEAILGTGAIRNATNQEIQDHKNGKNNFVSESQVHKGKYFTVAGETFFRNLLPSPY